MITIMHNSHTSFRRPFVVWTWSPLSPTVVLSSWLCRTKMSYFLRTSRCGQCAQWATVRDQEERSSVITHQQRRRCSWRIALVTPRRPRQPTRSRLAVAGIERRSRGVSGGGRPRLTVAGALNSVKLSQASGRV